MQHPLGPTTLIWLVMLPLIAWRIWRRVRRSVGRQKLGAVRPWVTLVVFPILLVLLGMAALRTPNALPAELGGAAVGVVLGVVGFRLTKFERTSQGFFYTPNTHLGIALSLVLVARLAYRLLPFAANPGALPAPQHTVMQSPLTLGIFGMLAGYYTCYAACLIRWRSQQPGLAVTDEVLSAPPVG